MAALRIEEKESRSKNMYARVKEENFRWIHKAAKQTKRSLSDYVDTLIEKLRANGSGTSQRTTPARALKAAERDIKRAERALRSQATKRKARKSKRVRARH